MFHNLIESGSHRRELKRSGRFLLGTFATYTLLVALAGVASVTAYTAHLGAQNFEITMLPPWTPPATSHPNAHDNAPAHPTRGSGEVPTRRIIISDLNTTPRTPPPISTQYNPILPAPPDARLGERDTNPPSPGLAGQIGVGGSNAVPVGGSANPRVVDTEDVPPPEPRATPRLTPPKPLVLSQLIASKIINKPVPPYPVIAKATRTQGTVTVEILVDEQGRVVSATATNGPAMLREAARQAALLARFTPTQLNGQPVKVSGVISYNFVLQ